MNAVDLAALRTELARAPLLASWRFEVAIAVVNDVFRLGGEILPPSSLTWTGWAVQRALLEEQVGVLAQMLAGTSIRATSVAALGTRSAGRGGHPAPAASLVLPAFFDTVAPLTADMIRTNAFRQEEFVRRWTDAVGARIAGEEEDQSARRLEQLDYRRTMAEYGRAEAARKQEAERRIKLQKEAEAKAAAERGWRE